LRQKRRREQDRHEHERLEQLAVAGRRRGHCARQRDHWD
jgi:hypothetical protein